METIHTHNRRVNPAAVALAATLGLALFARLLWLAYTNFTEEDAFIVFRFARNLAGGLGFVFNPGERVYGSTTPLYTFILALWRLLTGGDFIFGARLICIGASIGSFAILAAILRRMQVPPSGQFILLGLLGISTKACLMDTQGLETPLVILLMMASWYLFIAEKPGWAGLLAGILLWVRIDTLLWPVALAIAACLTDFRRGLKLLAAAGIVYLPWVVFAWRYFGSPVPLTVLAKWTTADFWLVPLQTHLTLIIGYLSPLDFGPFVIDSADLLPALIAGFFTLILAAWHGILSLKKRWLLAPLVFIVIEFVRLADTRAAIDNRYFHPLLWFVWILFFLGVCSLWEKVKPRGRFSSWIPRLFVVAAAGAIFLRGANAAGIARDYQIFRNGGSLKEVGLWLGANTPPDSAILLEPLGYIGYYSGRRLVDDAGLVTPRAIMLRLQGFPRNEYYRYSDTDYIVMHCDYPGNMRYLPGAEDDFLSRYRLAARIDPLQYNPGTPAGLQKGRLSWAACYAVWKKK